MWTNKLQNFLRFVSAFLALSFSFSNLPFTPHFSPVFSDTLRVQQEGTGLEELERSLRTSLEERGFFGYDSKKSEWVPVHQGRADEGKAGNWAREGYLQLRAISVPLDGSGTLNFLGELDVANFGTVYSHGSADLDLSWSKAFRRYVVTSAEVHREASKSKGAPFPFKAVWGRRKPDEQYGLLDSYYKLSPHHQGVFWRGRGFREIKIDFLELGKKGEFSLLGQNKVVEFGSGYQGGKATAFLSWSEFSGRYEVTHAHALTSSGDRPHTLWFTLIAPPPPHEKGEIHPSLFPPSPLKQTSFQGRKRWWWLRSYSQVTTGDVVWVPCFSPAEGRYLLPGTSMLFFVDGVSVNSPVYGVYRWTPDGAEALGVWAGDRWIPIERIASRVIEFTPAEERLFNEHMKWIQRNWGNSNSDYNGDLLEVATLALLEELLRGSSDGSSILAYIKKSVRRAAYEQSQNLRRLAEDQISISPDRRWEREDLTQHVEREALLNLDKSILGDKLASLLDAGERAAIVQVYHLNPEEYGWRSLPMLQPTEIGLKNKSALLKLRQAIGEGRLSLADFEELTQTSGAIPQAYGVSRFAMKMPTFSANREAVQNGQVPPLDLVESMYHLNFARARSSGARRLHLWAWRNRRSKSSHTLDELAKRYRVNPATVSLVFGKYQIEPRGNAEGPVAPGAIQLHEDLRGIAPGTILPESQPELVGRYKLSERTISKILKEHGVLSRGWVHAGKSSSLQSGLEEPKRTLLSHPTLTTAIAAYIDEHEGDTHLAVAQMLNREYTSLLKGLSAEYRPFRRFDIYGYRNYRDKVEPDRQGVRHPGRTLFRDPTHGLAIRSFIEAHPDLSHVALAGMLNSQYEDLPPDYRKFRSKDIWSYREGNGLNRDEQRSRKRLKTLLSHPEAAGEVKRQIQSQPEVHQKDVAEGLNQKFAGVFQKSEGYRPFTAQDIWNYRRQLEAARKTGGRLEPPEEEAPETPLAFSESPAAVRGRFNQMLAAAMKAGPGQREAAESLCEEFGPSAASGGGVQMRVPSNGILPLTGRAKVSLSNEAGKVVRVVPVLKKAPSGQAEALIVRIFGLEGREVPRVIWGGKKALSPVTTKEPPAAARSAERDAQEVSQKVLFLRERILKVDEERRIKTTDEAFGVLQAKPSSTRSPHFKREEAALLLYDRPEQFFNLKRLSLVADLLEGRHSVLTYFLLASLIHRAFLKAHGEGTFNKLRGDSKRMLQEVLHKVAVAWLHYEGVEGKNAAVRQAQEKLREALRTLQPHLSGATRQLLEGHPEGTPSAPAGLEEWRDPLDQLNLEQKIALSRFYQRTWRRRPFHESWLALTRLLQRIPSNRELYMALPDSVRRKGPPRDFYKRFSIDRSGMYARSRELRLPTWLETSRSRGDPSGSVLSADIQEQLPEAIRKAGQDLAELPRELPKPEPPKADPWYLPLGRLKPSVQREWLAVVAALEEEAPRAFEVFLRCLAYQEQYGRWPREIELKGGMLGTRQNIYQLLQTVRQRFLPLAQKAPGLVMDYLGQRSQKKPMPSFDDEVRQSLIARLREFHRVALPLRQFPRPSFLPPHGKAQKGSGPIETLASLSEGEQIFDHYGRPGIVLSAQGEGAERRVTVFFEGEDRRIARDYLERYYGSVHNPTLRSGFRLQSTMPVLLPVEEGADHYDQLHLLLRALQAAGSPEDVSQAVAHILSWLKKWETPTRAHVTVQREIAARLRAALARLEEPLRERVGDALLEGLERKSAGESWKEEVICLSLPLVSQSEKQRRLFQAIERLLLEQRRGPSAAQIEQLLPILSSALPREAARDILERLLRSRLDERTGTKEGQWGQGDQSSVARRAAEGLLDHGYGELVSAFLKRESRLPAANKRGIVQAVRLHQIAPAWGEAEEEFFEITGDPGRQSLTVGTMQVDLEGKADALTNFLRVFFDQLGMIGKISIWLTRSSDRVEVEVQGRRFQVDLLQVGPSQNPFVEQVNGQWLPVEAESTRFFVALAALLPDLLNPDTRSWFMKLDLVIHWLQKDALRAVPPAEVPLADTEEELVPEIPVGINDAGKRLLKWWKDLTPTEQARRWSLKEIATAAGITVSSVSYQRHWVNAFLADQNQPIIQTKKLGRPPGSKSKKPPLPAPAAAPRPTLLTPSDRPETADGRPATVPSSVAVLPSIDEPTVSLGDLHAAMGALAEAHKAIQQLANVVEADLLRWIETVQGILGDLPFGHPDWLVGPEKFQKILEEDAVEAVVKQQERRKGGPVSRARLEDDPMFNVWIEEEAGRLRQREAHKVAASLKARDGALLKQVAEAASSLSSEQWEAVLRGAKHAVAEQLSRRGVGVNAILAGLKSVLDLGFNGLSPPEIEGSVREHLTHQFTTESAGLEEGVRLKDIEEEARRADLHSRMP